MPLWLHGLSGERAEQRVREQIERVGLHPEHAGRYPHEFSGGQRQRIGVALALALEPRLMPPNPIDLQSGCVFHPRCPHATDVCREVEPPLARYPDGHLVACHHPLNVSAEEIAAAERDPTTPLGAGEELPSA